jgi:hypothetical protein
MVFINFLFCELSAFLMVNLLVNNKPNCANACRKEKTLK